MSYSFRTNGNFIDFVNIDSTSLSVETIIMSLHNTSKCIDWSLPEDTTRINFTIDELKYSNLLITEIDFDGVVMGSQDDFETNIETMFPALAGGGSLYLVYRAIMSQDGGATAPTEDYLIENTLGGTLVWGYSQTGVYSATLAGAFPTQSKVAFIAGAGGYAIQYEFVWVSANELSITTLDPVGAADDGRLYFSYIEIRVYP